MRICHHPLRPVARTSWLTCDACCADFPHRDDCPGLDTDACTAHCMNAPPTPTADQLAALYALPAYGETR